MTSYLEGTKISKKYRRTGSQFGDLLNPSRGIRDDQRRRGIKPVNHMRRNQQILREKEENNRRLKQQQADSQQKQKFVLKQFRDVKSKVGKSPSKAQSPSSENNGKEVVKQVKKKAFLRKSTPQKAEKPHRFVRQTTTGSRKAPTPSACDTLSLVCIHDTLKLLLNN